MVCWLGELALRGINRPAPSTKTPPRPTTSTPTHTPSHPYLHTPATNDPPPRSATSGGDRREVDAARALTSSRWAFPSSVSSLRRSTLHMCLWVYGGDVGVRACGVMPPRGSKGHIFSHIFLGVYICVLYTHTHTHTHTHTMTPPHTPRLLQLREHPLHLDAHRRLPLLLPR